MSIFKAVQTALLVGGIWIASVPVAELFFRAIGDSPSDDLSGLYAAFRDGSYRLAKNINTKAIWASGSFTVHTDQLGLRCDEARRFATKPEMRLTGLFLGDSQGFGNGVSFEESLAGVTAGLAGAEGLHLGNTSVGGHAIRNQLDIARWLKTEHGVSASNYILLATPLMVQNPDSFTRSSVGEDGRLYDAPMRGAAAARLWAKTHLVVYNRWRDALRNSALEGKKKDDSDQVLQLYAKGEKQTSNASALRKLLAEVQAFATENNARLHLIYVPLSVEADFGGMDESGRRRGLTLDSNLPANSLSVIASDLGVTFTDLRPVLRRLHEAGDPLRLKGDFHYGRPLSKACGETIWNELKNQLKPLQTTPLSPFK